MIFLRMRKMKKISKSSDLENDCHLEIFDEENSRDILVDDQKDLEQDLTESTRFKFLTWNDF